MRTKQLPIVLPVVLLLLLLLGLGRYGSRLIYTRTHRGDTSGAVITVTADSGVSEEVLEAAVGAVLSDFETSQNCRLLRLTYLSPETSDAYGDYANDASVLLFEGSFETGSRPSYGYALISSGSHYRYRWVVGPRDGGFVVQNGYVLEQDTPASQTPTTPTPMP